MKKYVRFLGFMLALSTVMLFSACSSDDDDNNSNNGNTNTANMTGKINGKSFSWTGNAEVTGDVLQLKASGGIMVPRISLYVPSDVIAGQSYSITRDGDFNAIYMNDEGFQITVGDDDGMITITEHDKTKKTIKGTFYFSTPETSFTPAYSITDGSFSYVYEILF